MFRTLIRTLSISALALMALTGFGAQAAHTISGDIPTTDATTTQDGTYQLACAWYQRRTCIRTPTAVAGVRG